MPEELIYVTLVLATFAYPFFVEDRITLKTVFWAVLFAIFAPITTFIFAMNHREQMLHLRGRRVQRAEREKREANSN